MNKRLGLEHKPLDASYGDPQVPKMLCCLWKKQYLLGNTYISMCSDLELEEVTLLSV